MRKLSGNPKPKAGPGRPKGFTPAAQTVRAIKVGMILARLQEHVDGTLIASGPNKGLRKVALEPSQVTAALGLLKKVIPDLSSVEHKGDPEAPLHIITRAE